MKKKNYNSAIILCGGKGTRLGILGRKLPKTLIKIMGKPIIWYIMKFLQKNSINHFILPVGYKGEMIIKYFKNNLEFKDVKIDIINTGVSSSIAYRIYKIKKKIISQNFILLNGDAVFNFNIKKFLINHMLAKTQITFLGCAAKLSYGIIGLQNGEVKSFERETDFNAISSEKRKNFIGYIYSGISILNKNLIFKIKFKKFKNFEKQFYPKIIKKYKSNFKLINGFWHSVDNQKDLKFFNKKYDKSIYNNIVRLKKYLSK